jgi:ABC-type multidrug transport system ATPase subunit
MTIFLTTSNHEVAETLADRAGLLARGRLVADGPLSQLVARFRRIRFVTRQTETRTTFGTELDEFDAVRVRVRGWGADAVVSNYDDSAFDRLRGIDGVSEASASPMTLADILESCRSEND